MTHDKYAVNIVVSLDGAQTAFGRQHWPTDFLWVLRPMLAALFGGDSPLRWQPPKASRTETMNRRPFAPLFMGRCTKAECVQAEEYYALAIVGFPTMHCG